MRLTGIHFLITYQCSFECDHCFVWGSPFAGGGALSLAQIRNILRQAKALGTVNEIYFEGGEPFLFHPVLVEAVWEAERMGFDIGIVSNGYWATSVEDAMIWLRPLAGHVVDLSLSADLFHGDEVLTRQVLNGKEAARRLGIPSDYITVERPDVREAGPAEKGTPVTGGQVKFRGRAVAKLLEGVQRQPWREFTECPFEDLADPGRVHVDPYGYLHVCQGLAIGNIFEQSLKDIVAQYQPANHPIIGPLLSGGPVALVDKYDLPHAEGYADACHLCYTTRETLRPRFPDWLAPGQMYGKGLT